MEVSRFPLPDGSSVPWMSEHLAVGSWKRSLSLYQRVLIPFMFEFQAHGKEKSPGAYQGISKDGFSRRDDVLRVIKGSIRPRRS